MRNRTVTRAACCSGGWQAAALGGVLLMVAACTSDPRLTERDPRLAVCLQAYGAIDQAVLRTGVRDAEASRVQGFPHLRASRFLASFAERDLSKPAFEAWVGRLAALDRDARSIELMNLPADRRTMLDRRLSALHAGWSGAEAALDACSDRLVAATIALGPADPDLRRAVAVPDDYSTLARTLGLYPLTAVPVALGYQRWRSLNLPAFDRPVEPPAEQPTALVYRPRLTGTPLSAAEVAGWLAEAAREDPLGIPDLEHDRLRAVAEAFAPALLIDPRSEADRIGWPTWRTDGLPEVDRSRPAAFVRLEHTWFEGRPIVQLVYLFWFDERPPAGPLDWLAGRLDGVIWRVSLGADGRPLVFDTIHACGCYHLFFPTAGVRLRELPENRPSDPRDPVLVPSGIDVPVPDQRVVVRLAAGSHYVTGTGGFDPAGQREDGAIGYQLVIDRPADRSLRSLPWPGGGSRSLYRPDGIVAGTERHERVLLWPMGILEAGAMRQWGRHATAFVGRRHFDDPDLIERGFAR